MLITIPWNTGSGNICIEYVEGGNTLSIYSDAVNADSEERSQVLNVMTTAGSPQVVVPLTVRQGGRTNPYLLLESGGRILLEDGGGIVVEGSVGDVPRLPADYQEVDFIEGTGSQEIDTGYDPVKSTVIEVGYEFTSIPASQYYYVFGNYNASGKNSTRLMTSRTNGDTIINMFTKTDYSNFKIAQAKQANVRYDDVLSNTNYVTNGTSYAITDTTEGTSNTRNLALFANYVGGRKSYMKLYYCRIKEGDTLVRDFVPCYRKSDGVAGLYDIANDVFYAGSGTFTKGDDV